MNVSVGVKVKKDKNKNSYNKHANWVKLYLQKVVNNLSYLTYATWNSGPELQKISK